MSEEIQHRAGTGKLASVNKIWAYLDQQWMLARPRMQAFTNMVRQLEGRCSGGMARGKRRRRKTNI